MPSQVPGSAVSCSPSRTVPEIVGATRFAGAAAAIDLVRQQEIGTGGMTQGDFFSFVVAAFMMYGPIKKLSRVNANLQQAIAASERIFELLDTHSEVRERPGAGRWRPSSADMEFRNVTFQYEDDPSEVRASRRVVFGGAPGQVIALVGLSGAGKTTLVNLIPRFFDVRKARS